MCVTNDGSHASETDGYDINSGQNKTKAKFLSGLVPNWQSKLSAPSQSSLKTKPKVSEPEDIALGGLDDKDAFATFSPVKLKGTGRNRTNDVSYQWLFPIWKSADVMQSVIIVSVSEESDAAPVKKKTAIKPKTTQKSAATKLEVKPNLNPKPKPRSANLQLPNPKIERTSPAASNSGDSHDVNSLPEFARSAWSTSFLPTLYDLLARASDLFVIDADMVKVIQNLVNIVYPYAEYKVTVNDKIFIMVCVSSSKFCFRVTDIYLGKGSTQWKKELFQRTAIKIITEFFRGDAYANKPKEIAKYTEWATRGDGPAIYGIPSPIHCVNRAVDDYIVYFNLTHVFHVILTWYCYQKPHDIFESKPIIQLSMQYLKWCKGSCYEDGRPYGAISMAATAVSH